MNSLLESLCAAWFAQVLEAALSIQHRNLRHFFYASAADCHCGGVVMDLPIHTISITEKTGGGDWVPSFPVSKTFYEGGVLVGDRSRFAGVVPPAMLNFAEPRGTSLRLRRQKKQ